MAKKLQLLKRQLKEWNKNVFGNFNRKIEENLVEIQRLDTEERLHGMSETLRSSILKAKGEFHKLSKMKEIYWRQQARVEWFMQNERNTKFFHKRASFRQRSNSFSQLNVNGSLTSDKETIKAFIVQYYSELFREDSTSRPQLDGLEFPSIDSSQAAVIEGPCDEDEVRGAIHDLGGDRSPGPDGFPIMVFSRCWNFMKEDILAVVNDLFLNAHIDWRLKSTFIFLAPKQEVVVNVSDFRPISLMGSINKILSKILATRLKGVMEV